MTNDLPRHPLFLAGLGVDTLGLALVVAGFLLGRPLLWILGLGVFCLSGVLMAGAVLSVKGRAASGESELERQTGSADEVTRSSIY